MNPIMERAAFAIVGAFVAMIGAYFTLGKSISNELHFVKGQLVMIMQQLTVVSKVQETSIGHGKDLVKVKGDVDNAHDKIRSIERILSNGSGKHG